MEDSRAFTGPTGDPYHSQAGIISKIRLENFMCHSNLEIEFGDSINFVTGQNGSGKSAILTALCVAFGCRAKGTQRAATLKDFIKTGCSYAVVDLQIKNQGDDAFKPDLYGDMIIIERRISETTSSLVLKNQQGRKVASRREDLRELVEHFNVIPHGWDYNVVSFKHNAFLLYLAQNIVIILTVCLPAETEDLSLSMRINEIDVENPCVIMSQDKSREFLHSGNDKDKFKFYFKATLLHQVDELLKSISSQLVDANEVVNELESSIRPVERELKELQEKIKNMEHIEEISQKVQLLKKRLAWSWVYDVDKQLQEQSEKIETLKSRIPKCQDRIDSQISKIEELRGHLTKKKAQIASMMERTSEVRRMKDELQQSLSLATKERLELEGDHGRKINLIQKMVNRVKSLEQKIHDIHEEHTKNTQVLCHTMFFFSLAMANCSELKRLKEEEEALSDSLSVQQDELEKISREIADNEKKHREIGSSIRDLRLNQSNKVTAFGGFRVTNLLQAIERHHHRFKRPPIGPIGAHVLAKSCRLTYCLNCLDSVGKKPRSRQWQSLVNGDTWAVAVESAVGKILNAFIVTDHKDSVLLRGCAKEAGYNHLQIVIYDFARPRLSIPNHMLPQTNHPTTISVLHSDNPTVLNVLVDLGNAERQVLVRNYDVGKTVAFEQRVANLKEVFTSDGYKMFSRANAQTILPPNKKGRASRLCGSYDNQIKNLERDALSAQEQAQQCRGKKRKVEEGLQDLNNKLQSAKRRCWETERLVAQKKYALQDVKNSQVTEASSAPASNVDELLHEISKIQEDLQENEMLVDVIRVRMKEADAKASDLKASFENLCGMEKIHYEKVMNNKVLPEIKVAEAQYEELKNLRTESYRKASIICPESDLEALEGCEASTPEQLSDLLSRLNRTLQRESDRYDESIEDLRMLHQKKERKILRKQQTYKALREKLNACQKALNLRLRKFERNASDLKRQLTWKFNGHLKNKGISGLVKVNYAEEKLSIEVKMPQDASSNNVRDTRGLSGGERSFSTLCFALALHEMTEAPFRAMDEFDVFMDAVSRKISLDTLVDFALAQGSQWIFITPHDISMVKQGERIKKQQMAAPRT
ncbi:hypothetical protein RHSIM_Rhsim03G0166000 [Rhododendron simsii]|uniref:RecF/RecN/SMC N-terminal domain-containing protein n=1 Tax=Rhododendron simsii TaxID=118357 RepID=A0A834H7L2_RHOSS|nr:hypothetical protein RHSIM_Rhsim03G0166000 [Rhododendron simsii]